MRKILVLAGFLTAGLLIAATLATAQQEEDQGLRLGGQEGTVSEDVVQELRDIHDRLGALLRQLGEAPADGAGLDQLERRVASLERQVRGQTVGAAREELQALRTQLQEDGEREGIRAEVERIRSDLQRSFADGETRDFDWETTGRELTTTFDALIEQLGGEEDPDQAFEETLGELERVGETLRTAQADRAEDEEQDAVAEAEEGEEEAEGPFEWETLGPQIYAENCAACHQANGQGVEGSFPPLAGNPFVTGNPEPVISVVLHGRGGMPSFSSLSDEEIAAVISHERNAWDNEADEVTPQMVETVREGDPLEDLGDPQDRPGAAD